MRRVFSFLVTVCIIAAFAVGGGLYYGKTVFDRPGPTQTATQIQVERGAGLIRIANMLESKGVISDARIFRFGARLEQAERSLKAGEYEIPAGASMAQILALIESGETITRRFTIPEGLTSQQIVAILYNIEELEGQIILPPEGILAPETYFFERGENRQEVVNRMLAAQTRIMNDAWANRADDLPFDTADEALILASIVEKETAVASELDRVAGVFVNRLRKGMRLQSDPTVIYGVAGGAGLDRPISRADLRDKNDYNTYVIDGLPPTPIAHPGEAAIRAVMNPAETTDLYFVADGTGGHAFAKTLAEHNRNVRKWRKIERERNAQ